MQRLDDKINKYSFGVVTLRRVAPVAGRQIPKTPEISLGTMDLWGFLFSILPVKTGPVSPVNLGSLAIHILYVTILFMRPKFLRLKIRAFLYPFGKPLGGLAKPS